MYWLEEIYDVGEILEDVFLVDFFGKVFGYCCMINFDKGFEYKSLDFKIKVMFFDECLIKEEERDFIVGIFLNLEAIISERAKADVAISFELEVGPFSELLPDKEESGFV